MKVTNTTLILPRTQRSLCWKISRLAREEGNAKEESSPRLFFIPVVPRASRLLPVARASRSSRETPEELRLSLIRIKSTVL